MKGYLIVIGLLLTQAPIFAQFGVTTRYSHDIYPEWEDLLNTYNYSSSEFLNNGYEIGFNYWFRLKNKRVEFLPEISYYSSNEDSNLNESFRRYGYYLNFTTQIYTLDFEGDCNCPTFGKEGGVVKKGFFVGVTPSIGLHGLSINDKTSDPEINLESTSYSFRIGVNTGLDIGITEWFTITPLVFLNYHPELTWFGLESVISQYPTPIFEDRVDSKAFEIQPSIRLTFRPDYLREQRSLYR